MNNVIQLHLLVATRPQQDRETGAAGAIDEAAARANAIYEQLRAQASRRRSKPALRLIKGGKADV
jgi:hypothetical protein